MEAEELEVAVLTNNGRFDSELETLAYLSPLEYDTIRESKAKELNVRVGTLDKEVAKRRETESEAEACEIVEEISPWDEPVNGELLLDKIRESIQRHVILPGGTSTALALWVLGSYAMDAWRLFPKVLCISAEKRSGKTTLMESLEALLYRSLLASNISAAALFRCIEEWRPSVLIDEADRFVKDNEELNGIINAGHTRRTAFVLRVEKINNRHVPQRFSVWGAQALAGIGKQQDTLMDRSIVIEIRRKASGETCHRLPLDHFEQCRPLRRRCLRWAIDHIDALKKAAPEVPVCGNDRAQDNWNPLFAIADLAGGRWSEDVREAYQAINSTMDEDDSAGIMLLTDIKKIFDARDRNRIHSEDLVASLVAMEGRPWAEWKRGYPMTKNTLSRLLSPFKIRSQQLKIAGTNLHGYERKAFEDAFDRYLSKDTPVQIATTLQANTGATSSYFQNTTNNASVAFCNLEKPNKNKVSIAVAFQKGGNGCNSGDAYMPGALISAAVLACNGLKLDPERYVTELDASDYQDILTDHEQARDFAESLDSRLF